MRLLKITLTYSEMPFRYPYSRVHANTEEELVEGKATSLAVIKVGGDKKKLEQNGSTTVLVVAMLPIALLLMGLSIDAGRVMAAKSELYKASDVAARKIAEEIDMREASETGRKASAATDDDARQWVEKNLDGLSGGRLLDVNVVNDEAFVEVDSRAEVPLLFSGLINRRSTVVEVSSIGRLKPYTTAT